jgi:hypothetical protein
MGQKAVVRTTSDGQPKVDYYNENGDLRETRVGGDRAWRNNNPGNIRGDKSQIGTDPRPQTPGKQAKPPFSIFPDMETGVQAKADLLNQKYGGYTINDMIPKYSPSSDNNDVQGIRKNISNFSGLDLNKKSKT